MSLSELDGWYLSQEEPVRSCLLALRSFILSYHDELTESWTHRMPMFRLRGKLFAYLWTDKTTGQPYLGMYRGIDLEHPKLILGSRKKMKIMHVDALSDLPTATLGEIFEMAFPLYGVEEN